MAARMKRSTGDSVAFVGLGYVGLATAACMASRGYRVHGIDVDEKRLEIVRSGRAPIHEKGLEPLLRSSIRKKTLELSSNYEGLARFRTIFITVGTPSSETGEVDLHFVEAASKEIGRELRSSTGYSLVVVKSTVTPGTTEGRVRPILERESEKKVGKGLGLACNPEFLHEGSAIHETLHPEAIVIGGCDKKSTDTLVKMYDSFYGRRPSTILTTPSNAEMTKYAINAGRATQLSYVNTIANLCSRIPGCDYDEVRKGLSLVARMDERYLGAGLGFGGSCLPKDARALASILKNTGVDGGVVASALKVNEAQVQEALRLAEGLCGSLEGKRVSVLGLAFKAGTGDIRESVSIALTRALIKAGADLSVYDPVAMESTKELLGSQVEYAKSPKDCIRGSECVFVATGWDEFKQLPPSDFKALMTSPAVVDTRRLYSQDRFRKAGVRIATIGTGRPIEEPPPRESPKRRREWHYVVKDGKVRAS